MEFKESFTDQRGVTGEIMVSIPLVKSTEKERDELLHRFAEGALRLYLKIAEEINNVSKTP